jgi:outer membrane protein OmpA-like peptidoglycan-associated protein
MKYGFSFLLLLLVLTSTGGGGGAAAQVSEMPLDVLLFPAGNSIELVMFPTRMVPESLMKAKVEVKSEATEIEIEFERLLPAVLFGGDVTCYVLWAVNRDGVAQNLGELTVRQDKEDDKTELRTSMRSFALIVTAEPYTLVEKPSELVLFWNDRVTDPQVQQVNIHFEDFAAPPDLDQEELRLTAAARNTPLDLVQAERAYRLAEELGARKYAAPQFAQATLALDRARQNRNREGDRKEYSRASFLAVSQALAISSRKSELEQLERNLEKARTESEGLRTQLETALSDNRQKEATIVQLRSENNRNSLYIRELEEQRESLRDAIADLETRLSEYRREKQQLEAGLQSVESENREMHDRLLDALSSVAETRESERGFILKLPDILFEVGRDSLNREARVVLAKLAGILLIMSDHNLRIEGHTDSTGSAQLNLELSRKRAEAVALFLGEQGISSNRMETDGYGKERPIADNRTAQGRKQNRRVEIIIAEGEIL